ncbi:hypothetical protein C1645_787343, partial [Glomus cerebriforme]
DPYTFSPTIDTGNSIYVYFIINDSISILICGYYIVTLEKGWNSAPSILDYLICFFEFILWVSYVVLQFINIPGIIVTQVYGSIIPPLYIVNAILLIQWGEKLKRFGGNIPHTNIGVNNVGDEENIAINEMK